MRMPKKFTVMGSEVTITKRTDLGEEMGFAGRANWWERKVEMDVNPEFCGPPEVVADTLLHEVMHCAYRSAQLPAKGCKEEELVSRLTPVLLNIICNNPELISCLKRLYR